MGILLVGGKNPVIVKSTNLMEEKKMEAFFNLEVPLEVSTEKEQIHREEVEPYIAVLEIPKIHLKRGLYAKNSPYNQVDYNIQILDSDYPNIFNGNFILAGHSGVGQVAYFNDLNRLVNQDNVYVYYNGIRYQYQVVDSYEIEKTGMAQIRRNPNQKSLTLITCKDKNKQLLILCECVNQEYY